MVRVQQPTTHADRALSRLKAAILGAAESEGTLNENGTRNVILNFAKLHAAWQPGINDSIAVALSKTYGAKILDSNLDYSRKILIQVPADRANDFANDFAQHTTVQERH